MGFDVLLNDMTTVIEAINTTNSKLNTIEGLLGTIEVSIDGVALELAALGVVVADIAADATTLVLETGVIAGSTAAIAGLMIPVESNVSAIKNILYGGFISNSNSQTVSLTSIDAKLTTANASLSSLDAKATVNNSTLATIATTLTASNASLSSLDAKATVNNTTLAAIATTLTNINNNLLAINNNLSDVSGSVFKDGNTSVFKAPTNLLGTGTRTSVFTCGDVVTGGVQSVFKGYDVANATPNMSVFRANVAAPASASVFVSSVSGYTEANSLDFLQPIASAVNDSLSPPRMRVQIL